jgi:hypothetical protein
MFAADVFMAQCQRLPERQLKDLPPSRREREATARVTLAGSSDSRRDPFPGILQRQPESGEYAEGERAGFAEKSQQDVLAADMVAAELPSLLLREEDNAPRLRGESLEHDNQGVMPSLPSQPPERQSPAQVRVFTFLSGSSS